MPVHAMTLRTFTHDLKSGGESLVIDGPVIVRLVEKSGRVARLMELDPKYCDVIVRRWEDFTGGTATRVEATAAAQDAPAA